MLIGSVFLVREIDGAPPPAREETIHCVSEMTLGFVNLADVLCQNKANI